jgi:hypothetical protein
VKKKAARRPTRATVATIEPTFGELTSTLLVAIHAEWPQDRTRPGLVLSYLARDGEFYASIVRYKVTGPHGIDHEKIVVLSRREKSLQEAVFLLSQDFVATCTARAKLHTLVGRAESPLRRYCPSPDGLG